MLCPCCPPRQSPHRARSSSRVSLLPRDAMPLFGSRDDFFAMFDRFLASASQCTSVDVQARPGDISGCASPLLLSVQLRAPRRHSLTARRPLLRSPAGPVHSLGGAAAACGRPLRRLHHHGLALRRLRDARAPVDPTPPGAPTADADNSLRPPGGPSPRRRCAPPHRLRPYATGAVTQTTRALPSPPPTLKPSRIGSSRPTGSTGPSWASASATRRWRRPWAGPSPPTRAGSRSAISRRP